MEKRAIFCTNNVGIGNSHDCFPCAIQRRNMSVLGISSPVSMLPSGSGKMWVRSVA